jgi:hypothetical protein
MPRRDLQLAVAVGAVDSQQGGGVVHRKRHRGILSRLPQAVGQRRTRYVEQPTGTSLRQTAIPQKADLFATPPWADVRSGQFLATDCPLIGPTSPLIGPTSIAVYREGKLTYREGKLTGSPFSAIHLAHQIHFEVPLGQ